MEFIDVEVCGKAVTGLAKGQDISLPAACQARAQREKVVFAPGTRERGGTSAGQSLHQVSEERPELL